MLQAIMGFTDERNGVPFSSLALQFGNYPAALTNDLLYEAQSVYFFTLVVMQWGNLLSTRTRRSSIFQLPAAGVNRAAIPAAICALLIGLFFCYVPVFHQPSRLLDEQYFRRAFLHSDDIRLGSDCAGRDTPVDGTQLSPQFRRMASVVDFS
ncbi:hypothetical protein BJV78DRAFT_1287213 [Lactifluus subvellereus]|nr:hypothetical protein BJV78DRAFT_1287213 [Lactifluus subvellereus]